MQDNRLWDVPTRLFHWVLVLLFGIMWWTAEQGGDWLAWHIRAGLAVLTLVLFRVVWGLIGSDTARFARFLRGPAAIRRYLAGETAAPGHNPLGGWMVALMLLVLLVQTGTGLFAADTDSYLFDGPLARFVDASVAERLTGLHEANFNLLLGLVLLHVGAIFFYRLVKRQNLVRPMLTGRAEQPLQPPALRFAPGWLALVVFALIGVAVWSLTRI
ncbi:MULTISPECIES: cytochrome b/b6 domain-containing protein [Gulbenkiania]|uniref:Cytochrome b n=2 Tax=Gulbenkiania TaxID=397456 RepID=A0A0K6H059_9NEIS|nr:MULTISPECIES: cytochrome b/b6 domain-containing protein [Gulbenkiania]TCW31537.1 cytochrome b [Gulbenkiania mobilis]CUA84265.1 Cytochrome b [Gulbenkiania indica]